MKSRKLRGKTSGAKPLPDGDKDVSVLRQLIGSGADVQLEICARHIIARRQNHPFALKALAVALMRQNRYREALNLLGATARLYRQDAELLSNMGICHAVLLEWARAIECFNTAIEIDNTNPETYKNQGTAYLRMNRWMDAASCFLHAVELEQGEDHGTVFNLGVSIEQAGRRLESAEIFRELIEEHPDNLTYLSQHIGNALKLSNWSGLLIDLRRWHSLVQEHKASGSANPFLLFSFPDTTAEQHCLYAQAHAKTLISIPEERLAPLLAKADAIPGRRLRVGYLSADFRNHPVGHVLPEVIERHNRDVFEIFAYSAWSDDGSDIRKRLEQAFDHFVSIENLTDPLAAQCIKDDRIDILVDLQGWTAYERAQMLALRPAPVQVGWLGFAGTCGCRGLNDYLIGDPIVTPADQAGHYVELIAHLPNCYLPVDSTRAVGIPPARSVAGLPEGRFVFCSFNANYKINPAVFDCWCRILRACDDSVLWLSDTNEVAKTNLWQEAAQRGIDKNRVIFAPRIDSYSDHLARVALADLALDPFPYNSHSTGVDTLWAGVPMLSLLGVAFPGRVGASLLSSAKLPDLIVDSVDDYVERAIELYRKRDDLATLRSRLAAAHHGAPLFDMARFTKDLEELYSRMWHDTCYASRGPVYRVPSVRPIPPNLAEEACP